MKRLLCLLFCLLPLASWANHIIGGDISLLALDKNRPGYYRIQVIQYWETAALQGTSNQDQIINILIFRKRDPMLIEKLQVDLRTTVPLLYNNAACATQYKLKTTQAIYYRDYQFDVSRYTDPGGYFIVWERCCRNSAMTNLISSLNIGMMLYMEFPSLLANGATFMNSSPAFSLPDGDYICVNKPFVFDFSATDADGDQLRYSLVTPLRGYTNAQQINPDDLPKLSYPLVAWGPGFSEQNAIPGNPPLRINATTGELSVTADREGIFLFTVQVEEYRNGQRIGLIRRDFQLPVIDCARTKPPAAVVRLSGRPITEVNLCGNQTATLMVDDDPAYVYQWRKNGTSLNGVTSFSMTVADTGVYTVVKRFAAACGGDTVSPEVHVKRIASPTVRLSVAGSGPFCQGDTLTLQAIGQADYLYQWSRNDQPIDNGNRAALRVYQTGIYKVVARSIGATCTGIDTLRLTMNARPDAQLRTSVTSFCEGDSVLLTVADGVGYQYQWNPPGRSTSRLVVRQSGTYQVTITTPAGCTVVSSPVTLTRHSRPLARLDSVPPLCGPTAQPILLQGTPAGGQYAGIGVEGNQFVSALAGVGRHRVSYTVTSDQGCRQEAVRWIGVSPRVEVSLPLTYNLPKGAGVRLQPVTNVRPERVTWSPSTALDFPDRLQPIASPVVTTTYTLTLTSPEGCRGTAMVTVEVVDALHIPTAFTPNGDGINDVWTLKNTTAFPNCEVTVYNRWGEIIFFSKGYNQPWDGTYHQQPVEPGVYSYRIRTGEANFSYNGQLTIVK